MSTYLPKPKTLWRHWDILEEKINEEANWLRSIIPTYSKEEKLAPMGCRECFIRRIAILIIAGHIKAKEITKASSLKNFWLPFKKNLLPNQPKIYHGGEWHRETMARIENHFTQLGFKVVREPDMNQGRADLCVHKKGEKDLLIEVGTTSFFKLWRNLRSMTRCRETSKGCTYLIIPNDERLIEFKIK